MNKQEYDDRNYDFKDIPDDPRFKICFKEAMMVIGFWWVFVIATLLIMYTAGAGDPGTYSYVCGLPLWFFLVCLLIFCCIGVVVFLVKKVFQDFSLDDEIDS